MATPDGATEATDGIGSRGHLQRTLERARAAIRTSGELTADSRSVVARSEELVGVSAQRVQASLALRALLRASVTAYARRLHADGVPPQRMLVLVKTAVREATPAQLDPYEARDLMEDVVRWSVEAYYDAA
jgi:hypothetical protein